MATKEMIIKTKKKSVGKAMKVPSKKTMNFCHHQSSFSVKRMIPLILVLVLLSAAFVKVGILDQIAKKVAMYEELSAKQMQLSTIQASLSGYNEVADQYGRYSYGWLNENEINLVSRMDILKMVEDMIAPNCGIEDMAMNGNVLTMNIHGLTLHQASDLVIALEGHPLVDSATVYNAVAEEAVDAKIFLSINLHKAAEKEGE